MLPGTAGGVQQNKGVLSSAIEGSRGGEEQQREPKGQNATEAGSALERLICFIVALNHSCSQYLIKDTTDWNVEIHDGTRREQDFAHARKQFARRLA